MRHLLLPFLIGPLGCAAGATGRTASSGEPDGPAALEQLIEHARTDFRAIRGERRGDSGGHAAYATTTTVLGASECGVYDGSGTPSGGWYFSCPFAPAGDEAAAEARYRSLTEEMGRALPDVSFEPTTFDFTQAGKPCTRHQFKGSTPDGAVEIYAFYIPAFCAGRSVVTLVVKAPATR